MDAAEACFEADPSPKNDSWIEESSGYNLGTMGTNKPKKTEINTEICILKMSIKKPANAVFTGAERVGFEPTSPCGLPDFESVIKCLF